MRPLPLLASLCLLSSGLFAQQVTLRGKVEDIQGTSRFRVDCTDTELTSSSFDLNAFLGQQVLIQGTRVLPASPPTVEVSSIVASAGVFEIPGNPQIGGTLRFELITTPGTRASIYAARAPGFRSFPTAGVVFLDPVSAQLAAVGVVSGAGTLSLAIPVPADPLLIGLTVHAQAALVASGTLRFTNPDCKTIQ